MAQFKSIKLVGFKSFADKTEIPLTDGVTCIVGPNGCGKSNVADSIRWVLGEQSAKAMRGSQMMDVIFGGTEKRNKMSFCEVTLTFDNTNRIFDYDSDEIEMTRRLYRDGESEYILNRQPSRMKILTGLLHGAGAAKEGYSIIGQGRIAQIMNSRPEERRSIFEEATGIVVFKDRKADAERKLNGAKDNLYIFSQRMQEVERQLGPLAKAAESTRKYNTVYAELRKHEVNTYIYRHDGAAGERAKVNGRIEKYNNDIVEMTDTFNKLLKEYEDCRALLSSADGKLKELYEQKTDYMVGLEKNSGESKVFKEKANAVKNKLQSVRDDISYSVKRIGEIEKEARRSEDYASKNTDRINKYKGVVETLAEEIKVLSESISQYEYMTGEHRKKVMDAFKGLSEMKENIGSLSARKVFIEERLAEMQADMDAILQEKKILQEEYDSSVEKQNALNELLGNENVLIEKAQSECKAADEKLQLAIKRIYDIQAQILSLGENLKTYSALRERMEGYVYSVKRLLSDAKNDAELDKRIVGKIADLVSCNAMEYETAIETVFGGAMQNIITQTRDDARFLITYLKNNRIGQVTFLPVEAMRPRYENDQIKSAVHEVGAIGFAVDLVSYDKKYENVIHNLLGNTLIVDNIHNATNIARRYPRAFRIVTLDGDQISTSGSMTGGSRKENAANLLANERKLKEIEDDTEMKKAQLSRTQDKRDECTKEKELADNALAELQTKLQNAKLELATITEKQSGLLVNITNKEAEYSSYSLSVEELKRKFAEIDDQYSSTSQGATNLTEESDKASSEMNDITEKHERIIAERDGKIEKLNNYKVEIASLESALKSNSENVQRLNAEKAELISKIASLESSLPSLQKEMEDFNEKAARAALTKEEQVVLDDIIAKIDELENSKKTLNAHVTEVDEQRLTLYTTIENTKDKVHNQEMLLQKIDSDLEFLQQRISEEYGEDYEGCLKYKEEDYDISQSANAISSCKRQLTMLGSVNPNAIEEFEEVNARYEKMTEEKADLEKSIEDLTTALNDIREEMLKIFNSGFNTINENFKHTFKELFGGGKAELQLDYTDCEDQLNAGVEIVACPPGKKLSKISLLSGGEQALTAIAILFAIIQMRPMPFCVLDEIEAALDEANVGRYARYLKKFASSTQFIVITHRKPTMENADVLFGVTMEEKGVSKIVSVKLSEVESRLGGDTVS